MRQASDAPADTCSAYPGRCSGETPERRIGRRALGELERLSAAWGLAYQILDDFKDGLLTEEEVARDPTNQPELQIDTNDQAEYGVLARVLVAAKNADMIKIGFVQN